jgi:hypothetical protein
MARTIFGSEPTSDFIAARNTSRRKVMDSAEAARKSKAENDMFRDIIRAKREQTPNFDLLQRSAPNNLKLQQENTREAQRSFQLLSTE